MISNAIPRKKRIAGAYRGSIGRSGTPMMISAIAHVLVICALAFYIIPFIEKEGFVIELGSPQSVENAFESFQVTTNVAPSQNCFRNWLTG